MFGLLGPNRAGKSTLMRIITTVLPPSAGHIVVGGFDVRRQPGEVRRRLGYRAGAGRPGGPPSLEEAYLFIPNRNLV